MTIDGIPVYRITIDQTDKTGMDFVSLVDMPAIETNWVAMSSKKKPLKFTTDKEKQMLYGPIMIPDQPIYRYDGEREYYVVFSREVIEGLVRKFQTQQKTVNLNYQHKDGSQIPDAVIQEIWLTGKVDKSQELGFDLPVGTAFIGAHIGNTDFWNKEIKTGNVLGFSIEGYLNMELKKHKMEKTIKQKFVSAQTDKGELSTPDEQFQVGSEVTISIDGAEPVPAEGEYTLENGTVINCEAGVITSITEPSEEPTEEEVEQAMAAMIAPHLKPLLDKIAELEVKLSKIPAVEVKKETPKQTIKQTPAMVAMERINKIKNIKTK